MTQIARPMQDSRSLGFLLIHSHLVPRGAIPKRLSPSALFSCSRGCPNGARWWRTSQSIRVEGEWLVYHRHREKRWWCTFSFSWWFRIPHCIKHCAKPTNMIHILHMLVACLSPDHQYHAITHNTLAVTHMQSVFNSKVQSPSYCNGL